MLIHLLHFNLSKLIKVLNCFVFLFYTDIILSFSKKHFLYILMNLSKENHSKNLQNLSKRFYGPEIILLINIVCVKHFKISRCLCACTCSKRFAFFFFSLSLSKSLDLFLWVNQHKNLLKEYLNRMKDTRCFIHWIFQLNQDELYVCIHALCLNPNSIFTFDFVLCLLSVFSDIE